jgi:hypothetical protein
MGPQGVAKAEMPALRDVRRDERQKLVQLRTPDKVR